MDSTDDRSQEAAEARAAHETTEERKAEEVRWRGAAQEAVSDRGAATRAADALTEGGAADTAAKALTEGAANTAAEAAPEIAAAPKNVVEGTADATKSVSGGVIDAIESVSGDVSDAVKKASSTDKER
jgi:hypothetical protein